MNYRRKSTIGWSIGCIFLDIFGGIFSMMQMVINAYNYGNWLELIHKIEVLLTLSRLI